MFKQGIIQYSSGIAPVNTNFITEWTVAGDVPSRTIKVPGGYPGLLGKAYIDWGDGNPVTEVNRTNWTTAYSHTYATDGVYNVEIWGDVYEIRFNNGGDRLKITDIIQWGTTDSLTFSTLYDSFYGCENLKSTGTGSIPTSAAHSNFSNMFRGCSSITTVHEGLFANNIGYNSAPFKNTFTDCTSLETLPSDLFSYGSMGAYNQNEFFYETFLGCTSLVSIPAGLFDDTATAATGYNRYVFMSTFEGCSSLVSIPPGLFDAHINIGEYAFYRTFYGCSSLTSLPPGLFEHNTLVSTYAFVATFNGCSSLTSLPTDLFRYNTLAAGFGFCFHGCTSLETTPDYLFRYITVPGGFMGYRRVFYNCNALQINPLTFYAVGEEATSFATVEDFRECFYRTSSTGPQGTAPDIWNCAHQSSTGDYYTAGMYGGAGNSATSLSNYGSIPAGYK